MSRGGGGNDDEDPIPIDIHYAKLVDWLLSRNKTTLKWPKQLSEIKERIAALQPSLPLSSKTSHYFHCLDVFESLVAGHEGKLKTMFGSYTDETIATLDGILRDYRRDMIHLAEAGRLFTQNVDFEIPSLKKFVQTSEKQVVDSTRKIADAEKTAKQYRAQYERECAKMDVQGAADLRRALKASTRHLPRLFRVVREAAKAPAVREAVDFYETFVATVHNDTAPKRLTHLRRVMTEELPPEQQDEAKEEEEKEDGEEQQPVVELDVDWDIAVVDAGEGVNDNDDGDHNNDDGGGAVEIDWGDDGDLVVVGSGDSSTTADSAGGDPFPFEKEFLSDLLELEAFLGQRQREPPSPFFLESVSKPTDALDAMVAAVEAVLTALRDPALQRLRLIEASDSYVDRLASTLEQQLKTARRLDSTADKLRQRQAELASQVQVKKQRMREVFDETKALQARVEAEISTQYDNRPVNIFGDINNNLLK